MFTFIMFAVLFVLMYFMLFRGPKKQRAQQAKLISSLKKNDRVRTIGGIFGTVIDVRDDEVTLKIDESNNTKIRVAPEAISRVLTDDKKQE
ncbi:MAG: preprotein translocase subunit YajC [Planctomycetes bacterium GWF2_50_10]|nr:MAG: preprotein translocase subunit YajC [Planctomycetes bacterium GWF2_50_10]